MVGIRGVDAKIGLGVIFDEHGCIGRITWIAACLGGIRRTANIFAGIRRVRAIRHSAIAIAGTIVRKEWHFGTIATDLLRRRKNVADFAGFETRGVRAVVLRTLGHVAHTRSS